MTRAILSYFSILLMGVATASADQLDFNSLQIGEEVLGYYDGGNGSLGTGPGPNLGITYISDFVTVAQGVFGPPFQGEELTSTTGIMDVAPGFSGGFSFYYLNMSSVPGSLLLYSGLDGTGSLVGTLPLPVGGFGATGLEQLVPFESAVFNGNGLVFDNITFAPSGELVIPEPSSISLLLSGLLTVCWSGRKAGAAGVQLRDRP